MTVTFCGHRNISDYGCIKKKLQIVIEQLIYEGADKFYFGGYGSFDLLSANIVHSLKDVYPSIRSTLILPYLNREYYADLYDETVYPPIEGVPLRFAVLKRNEWMIEKSDIVVSYVIYDWGGAAASLKYAKRKKKRIISVVE